MSRFKVAVLPGDGVGPEVIKAAVQVLHAVERRFGHRFELTYAPIGGQAIDQQGDPLPPETWKVIRSSQAVLMGAVGGPKWDGLDHKMRPETGLLALRRGLEAYANLRPARLFTPLLDASPLKREVVEGVDLIIVRELTGGIYFGQPKGIFEEGGQLKGVDTEVYTESEVERVARFAFRLARSRRKRLTSVDKLNVLASSMLWRQVVERVARDFPEVELSHYLVDNCAMQLVRAPKQFDVILTSNMFGDILSDESAMLTGSIGMLPSASLGGEIGLYEPVHGSAPDIAGKNMANPIGAILSLGMMMRHSFGLEREAECIEEAVEKVLERGYRTVDLKGQGANLVGTKEMGQLIAVELEGGGE